MKDYALIVFNETSTWRGIVILLTLCGIAISPEQGEQIAIGGAALVGVLGTFLKDKIVPTKPTDQP